MNINVENRLSKIVVAALAVVATACSGGGMEGLEGEDMLESVEQQTVLPNEGVLITLTVGNDPASVADLSADLRFTDRPTPPWFFLDNGPWAANSTHTFALSVIDPENIHKIFLKYGGYNVGGYSEWWNIRGVEVHDIRNGVKSTPRYALVAPPGQEITGFSPGSAIYDEYYLPLPLVLKHSPSTNLNTFHEDFFVAYDTWNGADWCARIEDNKFYHAPWSGSGCNWVNDHSESYIDYLDWDLENNKPAERRATVNTSTKRFTIKRKDGTVLTASSPTLRYRGRDGSKWQMAFK